MTKDRESAIRRTLRSKSEGLSGGGVRSSFFIDVGFNDAVTFPPPRAAIRREAEALARRAAHHMPTQMFGYSAWSSTRIRIPPATTTTAVAVTMTRAAIRTEGGSRRKRDMLRSIGFGRATRGMTSCGPTSSNPGGMPASRPQTDRAGGAVEAC